LLTTPDLGGVLGIGAGALVGAVVVLAIRQARPSGFALAALNVIACTCAGIGAAVSLRAPGVLALIAAGIVAASAPISLALRPATDVRTASDIARYLWRVTGTVTLHLVFGVCFAALGFLVATAAVIGFSAI
jgi:hypothetical protein